MYIHENGGKSKSVGAYYTVYGNCKVNGISSFSSFYQQRTIYLVDYSPAIVSFSEKSAKVNVDSVKELTVSLDPNDSADTRVKWTVNNSNLELYSDSACTRKVGEGETDVLTVYAKGVSEGDAAVRVENASDSSNSASCSVKVQLASPYEVGTEWKLGETINLHGRWFMSSPVNPAKNRSKEADVKLPDKPDVTGSTATFNSFLPIDKMIDKDGTEIDFPGGAKSSIAAEIPGDMQGRDIAGIRLISGTGTVDEPFIFGLVFAPVKYPLWVGRTQVTSDNASNITGGETVTAKYNAENNTLTLSGVTVTEDNTSTADIYGVYYNGSGTLNIVLENANSIGPSSGRSLIDYGIFCNGDVIISGNGSLNINVGKTGIYAADVTIRSGDITAVGSEGIQAGNISISGGKVTAYHCINGIFCRNLSIDMNGIVNVTGGCDGILASGTVTINGGEVTASTSSPEYRAITGTVKNAIAGIGWKNAEGTEGQTRIEVNTTGHSASSLSQFKKIQFPAPYIVKFTDGLGNTLKTEAVKKGQAATAPEDPKRDGYTFNGWDTDFSSVRSDLTVTARWKQNIVNHTVTFEDGQGKVLDTQTVVDGRPATAPKDPTRNGFVFSGWDTDFSSVTKDLTVKALWTKESQEEGKYTVVFVIGFGNEPVTQEVSKGGSAKAPADPEVDGFTFTGWDKEFTNVTGNMTVTAQWKKNTAENAHTVVFVDGYSVNPLRIQRVKDGTSAKAPADPTREGYIFDGWDTDFSYVTSNLTVIAQWKQSKSAVRTVTVNSATVSAKILNAAVRKAGGSKNTVTTIILGKKVKKVSKGAFKNYKKAKTLVVKSKKLKKTTVKNSLKGSKITKVKVKVGNKKTNKKYVKKYKKIFTKKNAGRKVKVSI